MTFKKLLSLLCILMVTIAASDSAWQRARENYTWSFPEDHWMRSGYKTEWWYFTGHLKAKGNPDRRFGYQFTFFRIGLRASPLDIDSDWATNNLIMGHAAITDLSDNRHVFSEVLYRAVPMLGGFGSHPERVIAWSRAPAGTDGQWNLFWNGEAFDFEISDGAQAAAFQLSTRPLKPLIFQGPNGYSRKGTAATAASQYYSFTRLFTEGTLSIGGRTFQVQGESWMDKEFGSNQLAENQVGWDWFSLQLDDRRELMLYHLRDRSGATDFARGTLVSPTGSVRYLQPGEWKVRSRAEWKSAESGAIYPSRWIIRVTAEGLEFEVIPEVVDQENRSRIAPDLFYWEGAVKVLDGSKKKIGQGYVELTGYGAGTPLRSAL